VRVYISSGMVNHARLVVRMPNTHFVKLTHTILLYARPDRAGEAEKQDTSKKKAEVTRGARKK